MKFEYRLNANDLLEANKANLKGQSKWYLWIFLAIIIVSIISYLTAGIPLASFSVGDLVASLISLFVMGGILYLSITLLQPFLVSRAWRSQPSLQHPIAVEVVEDGLLINTSSAEAKLKWQTFTHFRETPNLFMVYQSDRLFNLFPKRAFSSQEQIDEFRELLRVKVVKPTQQ